MTDVVELDCRGMLCPMPVIRLAKAARSAADGTVIVLRADDPAARTDVPAWCRMRGQELVGRQDEPGSAESVFEVRCSAP